ncbi:MAG: POTRA domain-containing protein, partial [Myxococcota bacterium]
MQSSDGTSKWGAVCLALVVLLSVTPAAGQGSNGPVEYGAIDAPATASFRVAVLPFRLHSAAALGFLSGALDELLAERIEAGGEVSAVAWRNLVEKIGLDLPQSDESDVEHRRLAERAGLDGIISGSLTELAGRFSLDVRVTSVDSGVASQSLVLVAGSDRELLDRLGELADRIANAIRGGTRDRVVEIRFEGAGSLEAELRTMLGLQTGSIYDAGQLESDRRVLESDYRFARVTAQSEPVEDGVILHYRILRIEKTLAAGLRGGTDQYVAQVVIRGNQRVEEDAIRVRIRTAAGDPYDMGQVARDVRSLFQQGFYRDIRVFVEPMTAGVRVIFELKESPIVREIAVIGNENIDGEKIRDALTLTTGSPLDHPLLRENSERVKALYRSEGYYLAEVGYEIEEIAL